MFPWGLTEGRRVREPFVCPLNASSVSLPLVHTRHRCSIYKALYCRLVRKGARPIVCSNAAADVQGDAGENEEKVKWVVVRVI